VFSVGLLTILASRQGLGKSIITSGRPLYKITLAQITIGVSDVNHLWFWKCSLTLQFFFVNFPIRAVWCPMSGLTTIRTVTLTQSYSSLSSCLFFCFSNRRSSNSANFSKVVARKWKSPSPFFQFHRKRWVSVSAVINK